MTQFIIDEVTSRTPIGDLLDSGADNVIEIRGSSGKLLGTLLLPDRSEDERYEQLERLLEAEIDVLRERMARPASEGLTTEQFLAKLRQLGTDE